MICTHSLVLMVTLNQHSTIKWCLVEGMFTLINVKSTLGSLLHIPTSKNWKKKTWAQSIKHNIRLKNDNPKHFLQSQNYNEQNLQVLKMLKKSIKHLFNGPKHKHLHEWIFIWSESPLWFQKKLIQNILYFM